MAGKAGVDRFNKAEFEAALPKHKTTGEPLWTYAGMMDGEHVYTVIVGTVNDKVQIEVRSSVQANGRSAESGENSIRAWLTWFDKDRGEWFPLGSKVQTYITRRPGWQDRLTETLRTLYGWRLKAKNCSNCGKPKGIFKVSKTGANHGRVYASCTNPKCRREHREGFVWITEAKEAKK